MRSMQENGRRVVMLAAVLCLCWTAQFIITDFKEECNRRARGGLLIRALFNGSV